MRDFVNELLPSLQNRTILGAKICCCISKWLKRISVIPNFIRTSNLFANCRTTTGRWKPIYIVSRGGERKLYPSGIQKQNTGQPGINDGICYTRKGGGGNHPGNVSAKWIEDIERPSGVLELQSDNPADLALLLLAMAGDVHPNPGPSSRCPACNKLINDKKESSVWCGRGGWVYLKCTSLTQLQDLDENFDCGKCSWCALVHTMGAEDAGVPGKKEGQRKGTEGNE